MALSNENQNQNRDTVDGLPPVDTQIIDESGRLDPTNEEAQRALAILNGAPDPATAAAKKEQDEDKAPEFVDPRNEIAKSFRANRGRPEGEANEDLDIARVDPNNLAAMYGTDIVGTVPLTKTVEAADAPKVEPTYKVKVNGVEQNVTQEELLRTYQKIATADAYLKQASLAKNEAETMRQNASTKAEPSETHPRGEAQPTGQPDKTSTPKGATFDDAALAEVAEALQLGSTEEATVALKKLLTSVAPQQSNPLDISNEVRNVIASENYQRQSEEATGNFVTKYPSLASNAILQSVAGELASQEMAKDLIDAGLDPQVIANQFPDRRSLKKAYDFMRTKNPDFGRSLSQHFEAVEANENFKKLVGGPPVPVTVNVDRSERKAVVQPQPALRTSVPLTQTTPAPVSREQRQSDAVANMQKSRGQRMSA